MRRMHVVEGRSVSEAVEWTARWAWIPDAGHERQGLPDRVRRRLVEALGDGDTRLDGVARSLGLSAPALQRRLRETGASYEALVRDARRQLFMLCLDAGGRSVDEIAVLLGFPDPRGFHLAFRR